jgi:hypothetical protein
VIAADDTGLRLAVDGGLAKISSKTLVNLASRSRMTKRNGEIRSPRFRPLRYFQVAERGRGDSPGYC